MLPYIRIQLKQYYTSIKFWIFLAVFVLIMVLFSLFRTEQKEPSPMMTVGVVDLDDTTLSRMLVGYFTENPSFSSFAEIVTGDEETITKQFEAGEIYGYFVIPKGFISDLTKLKNTPISIRISTENPTLTLLAENILKGYEKYIRAVEQNAQAIYEKMLEDGATNEQAGRVNEEATVQLLLTIMDRESVFDYEGTTAIEFIPITEYYVYALLSVLIVFGSLLLCQDMIKEQELGILARNEVCGFHAGFYILQRLLVVIVKLLPFLGILFVCLNGLLKERSAVVLTGKILLLFVILYLLFELLVYFGLKHLSPANMRRGFVITLLVLFLLAFASGVMIPYMYLPGFCHSFLPASVFYRIMSFLAV